MRRKPCRVHGWSNANNLGRSHRGRVSNTTQQPLNTATLKPSPLRGWGFLLYLQQPKKFSRAYGAHDHRYARSQPLTSLRSARANQLATLAKRIRYAHTTKPTPPRSRSAIPLATLATLHQDHRIGVNHHTRKCRPAPHFPTHTP